MSRAPWRGRSRTSRRCATRGATASSTPSRGRRPRRASASTTSSRTVSSTCPTASARPATPTAATATRPSTAGWRGTGRRRPSPPASTACAWAATCIRAGGAPSPHTKRHGCSTSRTGSRSTRCRQRTAMARMIGNAVPSRLSYAVAHGMAAVRRTSMRVAGLFAGIGGLELGMAASGHRTQLLVENSAPAMHVLRRRFPDTKLEGDVRDLVALPARHRRRRRRASRARTSAASAARSESTAREAVSSARCCGCSKAATCRGWCWRTCRS